MFSDKVLRRVLLFVVLGLVLAVCGAVYAITFVSQQGYAPQGSGGFTFNSLAGTQAYYLSSGTNTATSVPSNQIILNLAGTGILSTNGGTLAKTGIYFQTAGTTTFQAAPLTLSFSNLNTLQIVGTGQLGYIYSK